MAFTALEYDNACFDDSGLLGIKEKKIGFYFWHVICFSKTMRFVIQKLGELWLSSMWPY